MRRLRWNNAKVQEHLAGVPIAQDFLVAAGFTIAEEPVSSLITIPVDSNYSLLSQLIVTLSQLPIAQDFFVAAGFTIAEEPVSCFFFTRVTGPRRSLSLTLSDTRVYSSEPVSLLNNAACLPVLNRPPGLSRAQLHY